MNERPFPILTLAIPLFVLLGFLALALSGWGAIAPGIRELAAYAVENRFGMTLLGLQRPALMFQSELALLAGAGLAVILLIIRSQAFWAAIVALAAIAVAWLLSWRMAVDAGLFFDAAYPSLGVATVFLIGLGLHRADVSDMRARLKERHGRHFSPAVMEKIALNPDLLPLTGEPRMMTVLVCSIDGYAAHTDRFGADAAGLRAWSMRVMAPLIQAVLDQQGTIERISPGGLVAFFNAPLDDAEHALHACAAALAMDEAVEGMNEARDMRGATVDRLPVQLTIGIETGLCIAGDFGREGNPDYAAAGRAGIRARGLEKLSEKFGPGIYTGGAVRLAAESVFAFLDIDLLPGDSDAGSEVAPRPVYALLGNPQMRASPKFRALQAFHEHIFRAYRAEDWKKARALIEQCRALSGANERLYETYLKRIAFLETHPPEHGWDGVFRPPAF